MELERRTLEIADIDIRNEGDDHHVVALVAPFNASYDAGRYTETLGRSIFDKSINERGQQIPLMHGHDRDAMPIGRSASWQKADNGLIADFKLARTDRSREALELAKDGYVTGFSVGFVPVRNDEKTIDGVRHITRVEAKLDHVALLTAPTAPAYADAQLIAARMFDPTDSTRYPRLSRWMHLLEESDPSATVAD